MGKHVWIGEIWGVSQCRAPFVFGSGIMGACFQAPCATPGQ